MEHAFLQQLSQRLHKHPQVPLGVGDDAALLSIAADKQFVVTTDLLADGTHFLRPQASLAQIGRKALAVNLSDLAAMAARPVAAFVSLLLPKDGALEIALGLYDGILPLAHEHGVAIAGGDTNVWDGLLVISVTVIGETTNRPPLRRDGARAGDAIVVTGSLGGSRSGKQFDFQPRVAEALLLNERYELHAGMDISDGVSLDLARMCSASGFGAMLELDAIPISPAARELHAADPSGPTPLARALGDGEDFELLLALPPPEAERMIREAPIAAGLTIIGSFVDEPGLWQRGLEGVLVPHPPLGYEH